MEVGGGVASGNLVNQGERRDLSKGFGVQWVGKVVHLLRESADSQTLKNTGLRATG